MKFYFVTYYTETYLESAFFDRLAVRAAITLYMMVVKMFQQR